MTDIELKIQELDKNKQYMVIVGKESGLKPQDLVHLRGKNITWIIVNDINQIEIKEREEFKAFIEAQEN